MSSSSINIKHFGYVKGGKAIFHAKELYDRQLLQLEGKEFELIIKERKRKVTISQFNYLFGAILPTCHASEMFAHYDKPEDIYEDYFAPKYLSFKKQVVLPDGRKNIITKYRSLTDLSVPEMAAFIEKVLADCAMNGIEVLDPESYKNKQYNL